MHLRFTNSVRILSISIALLPQPVHAVEVLKNLLMIASRLMKMAGYLYIFARKAARSDGRECLNMSVILLYLS